MAEQPENSAGDVSAAKDRPGVIAPPPLIFLSFLAVGFLAEYFFPLEFPAAGWRYEVGGTLIALAFGLAVWALPQFRRAGTHVDPYKPSSAIITSGPYRLTRNPLYVGLAILHAGISVVAASAWTLAMVLPALVFIRWGVIRREEAYLEAKFGDEYRSYKASVRRWI